MVNGLEQDMGKPIIKPLDELITILRAGHDADGNVVTGQHFDLAFGYVYCRTAAGVDVTYKMA